MPELLGVELARPGTWQLSSGKSEFTAGMLRDAADFHASTGGQRIPLGFGHLDNRFDGDPAWGWLTNVRYAEDDNGPVLLGDLVDLDDWVHAAAPARWPHRSIEGVKGVTFAGREYGLVLTRLALLGATPPGMPALKSLSDLRQLVAAAAAASGGEWIAASIPETTPQGAQVPTDRKGAVGMPDAAKLREALGLTAGASDDEVRAALTSSGIVASQPEPPKPAPNPTPAPEPEPEPVPEPTAQLVSASGAHAPGTLVIASSVWEETQNTIKRLAAHVDQTKRDEGERIIASAVEQGKFTPAQKPHFAKLWNADPEGTKALIEGLTPNSALAIAASGYADLDDKEFDREFAGLFPPGSMTKGA
jgi:Mu-like prophage I protein